MVAKLDPDKVLRTWTERDLSASARLGELAPAFEVEESLRTIADVLGSGRQPVLCGETGVGKSAIIHELVRRSVLGTGPALLAGKRVLQISLRARMSSLLKPEQMRPEMQKLVEALVLSSGDVVPFFRDLHLAYDLDLEPQLQGLGVRFRGAILGEADGPTFDRMLEGTPGLEQHYVGIGVAEAELAKVELIVAQWCVAQKSRGKEFSAAARSRAIELTHRFLARSRMPRKVIEFLGTVGSLAPADHGISEGDVLERFYQSYKVPRFLIDPAMPFDVDGTERAFRARVLGQGEAVRTVVRMISLIKAGLSDTRRPFGGFLFVGPTGVGKTHIAQLLAEYLFGSRDRIIRLNMADHQTPGDAYVLFGNPDGYTPRQRRGMLTQRLAGHPFGVLLLDEFEKANEKVHDRFLQLMDEGAFINGAAETVPCRSLIVIATSNAGAEVYRGQAIGFAGPADLEAMDRELDRLLYKHFRFEFLNRFDQVVHFHPLTRQDIRTIALREIEQLRERAGLKGRDLALDVDDTILDWLTVNGYDPHFGARFLKRTIERSVTTALAEVIVRENLAPGTRLALRIRGGRVVASVSQGEEAGAADKAHAVRVPEGTGEKVRSLAKKELSREVVALTARAEPHFARLEERRGEASVLLGVMNEATFWDDPVQAQRVLDRYRKLDVAIQAETRIAEPLRYAVDLGRAPTAAPAAMLARAVERALAALAELEERLAEEGAGTAWLLLRNADPLHPSPQWLEELAGMYLSWCRRLELAAEVVACGTSEEVLARVAIEVEGPGASAYLAMERGIHRVSRPNGRDARARVDVLLRGDREATHRSSSVRRRSGPLGLEVTCAGRAERDDVGLSLELFGASPDVLEALLEDLTRDAPLLVAPAEVARVYAQGGTGARDPRTGAVSPRFKDVIRGNLDPFLERWRARPHQDREG